MICNKCNNIGVLNTALGKEFYYCRTCKDEIQLEEFTIDFSITNKGTDFKVNDLVFMKICTSIIRRIEYIDDKEVYLKGLNYQFSYIISIDDFIEQYEKYVI